MVENIGKLVKAMDDRKMMERRLKVVTFMLDNYPVTNPGVRDWLIDEQNKLQDKLEPEVVSENWGDGMR